MRIRLAGELAMGDGGASIIIVHNRSHADGAPVELVKRSRMLNDTVFALGAVAVVLFVFGLKIGYSVRKGA